MLNRYDDYIAIKHSVGVEKVIKADVAEKKQMTSICFKFLSPQTRLP